MQDGNAIACGAVMMGANTYIGNGPNFMVKSIAESQGVAMPSFLGYMKWSGAVLLPIFAIQIGGLLLVTYVPAFLTSLGTMSEADSLWLSTIAAVAAVWLRELDESDRAIRTKSTYHDIWTRHLEPAVGDGVGLGRGRQLTPGERELERRETRILLHGPPPVSRQRRDAILGNGRDLAPELPHVVAVQPPGALQELRGVHQVRRAVLRT